MREFTPGFSSVKPRSLHGNSAVCVHRIYSEFVSIRRPGPKRTCGFIIQISVRTRWHDECVYQKTN